MELTQEQAASRIKTFIGITFCTTLPFGWLGYKVRHQCTIYANYDSLIFQHLHHYMTLPGLPEVTDRLVFTLQCHTVTLLIIFNLIALVGNTRFMSAWNPLNPETEKKMKVLTNILTKTVEQALATVNCILWAQNWKLRAGVGRRIAGRRRRRRIGVGKCCGNGEML